MTRRETVKVWDLPLRIFHWSLVFFFTLAFVTHEGPESVHVMAGYAVALLVIFRIIWGFVGTRHARFVDFVYGPRAVGDYLKRLFTGRPEHFYGHNPAGAWMVFMLLACLIVTSWTGLKIYALEEGRGPLALEAPSIVSVAYANGDEHEEEHGEHSEEEEFWEELHEGVAFFNVFLVLVHIVGAVGASVLHRENLILSMVTGRKPRHGG